MLAIGRVKADPLVMIFSSILFESISLINRPKGYGIVSIFI